MELQACPSAADGEVKITPVVYQFYPYAIYPHIPGVQVDLFWNGLETEGCKVWSVVVHCLVRSQQQEHIHSNSATAQDMACHGNKNFNIWRQNPLFGGIWNAGHQTMDGWPCRWGRSWTLQGHFVTGWITHYESMSGLTMVTPRV